MRLPWAHRAAERSLSEHSVCDVLASSNLFEEVTTAVLRAVCEGLDAEISELWLPGERDERLHCHTTYRRRRSAAMERFEREGYAYTFGWDEGLPGRAWASLAPRWIEDVRQDPNYPRAELAKDSGLRTGIAFPLTVGGALRGVIEVYPTRPGAPDDSLLSTMAMLGTELGQFLDRQRAEAATRKSEARERAIMDSALDCIITMDQSGRIIDFNPAAEQTFGYKSKDVVGRSLAEIIIPHRLRQKHTEGLKRYLATGENNILGQHIEIPGLRADGSEFPAELTVVATQLDGEPFFVGYIRDLSEYKEKEHAIKEREQRFRQLAESINEVFWLTDWDNQQIIYVSPAYERVWGRPVSELYQDINAWLKSVHPEDHDRVRHAFFQGVSNGNYEQEYRITRPAGDIRWIHDRGFPITDENGHVYRVAGIAEDVTRRHDAEQKLRDQQEKLAHVSRLSLMGEMASGISHELNQPLAAINTYAQGCLQRLAQAGNGSGGVSYGLEQIVEQASHAGRVINNLRYFARYGEHDRSLESISDLINEVMTLIRSDLQEADIALDLHLEEDLPRLVLGRVEIQQVILNLLRNAIEALRHGPAETARIILRATLADQHTARLTVSDNGPGLTDEALAQMFHPFYTTKESGTGMGLNVCETIVHQHEGRIWAEHNQDAGVSIHVDLPID
jgi:two-component system sensor kinase FixL